MKRWIVALALFAVLAGAGQASAAIRTENFDVDPGWTVVGSGSNGNNFGYQSASSYAGGSTGEGGGTFTRSDYVKYYADTDLGGSITLDQPFVASGKLDYTAAFHADFGYVNMLGHFATGGYGRIGIAMNYDGNANKFYWTPVLMLNDFTTLSASTAFTEIAPNVDRTWSYSWDPIGGSGYGRLTAILDGVSHTIDLTSDQRDTGATMDAFGFAGLAGPSSEPTWYANIYFDDVAYSVVPEPTTLIIWSLLGGLAIGIGWWRRRKAA